MFVDLPISLKPLFDFLKQASSVVASNISESFSIFQTFCKFQFVRLYRRNYDANLWHLCHSPCFGGISWCSFHHKNIMRLTSLEPNCHFCYFANGLTVSSFCYFLSNRYFSAHLKLSFIIKTRYILNVFANNLRWLPHQILTRGKMNNAIKTLSSTYFQLRTKRSLQKTSSSNYWNINILNHRNVFCSNYWNLTCQMRNAFINETENSFKI